MRVSLIWRRRLARRPTKACANVFADMLGCINKGYRAFLFQRSDIRRSSILAVHRDTEML
jgi:hypothetical protein